MEWTFRLAHSISFVVNCRGISPSPATRLVGANIVVLHSSALYLRNHWLNTGSSDVSCCSSVSHWPIRMFSLSSKTCSDSASTRPKRRFDHLLCLSQSHIYVSRFSALFCYRSLFLPFFSGSFHEHVSCR